MSRYTKAAWAELTSYEAEQVRQIAAWKSEPPNPFAELFKNITLPGARWLERVIPDRIVMAAIEKGYDLTSLLAEQERTRRQAGVPDLSELLIKPLEECDRLAGRFGSAAMTISIVEGAATGAGGVLTTLIDMPLLFLLSLWTIFKVGHCYGFALDQPKDRRYVLGVLIAAISGSLHAKQARLGQLHELEEWLLQETQEEIIAEELLSLLFQLEVFEGIPGIATVSGALLNMAFIHRVEITAQRVFQERWMRHNGKVDVIAPAEAPAHKLAGGWAGALNRVVYAGSYCLGYGAVLPACLVFSLFRPITKVGATEGELVAVP
ncbi:MAG: EcsC family protein [Isosphaeraceae bacterium]